MKKILILSVVLVVVLVAAAIVYFNWRHNFIRNKVPELVFLKSDSLYHISYGDVYIDEINGEVDIKDLVLRPDTTHKNDPGDKIPHVMLEVSIPRLHLTGLRTEQAMVNEELIARKLQLSRPVVTLLHNNRREKKEEKERGDEFTTRGVYKAILRNLIRIKIDSLIIDTAQYNMVRWQSNDTLLTGSPVNVALFDLDISDSTATDTSRVLFAKRAILNVDSLVITNESKLYSYQVSNIELLSQQKMVTAKTISVIPRLSEEAFMRNAGKQIDRFDVDFTGARFNNIDVDHVLDGNIVADNLTIDRGVLKIFRDKSYPRRNVNKVGQFPHQLLMKMPVDVSIKQLNINSGYIEYKEKSDLTGNSGKIRFNDITIGMTNLTNRQPDLTANPVCNVSLRARFLNVVPVSINLKLYPAHENGKFGASGSIAGTDAKVFNELVTPLGLANIESGKLNSCSFNFDGNDYGAIGTVKLLYNDLKIKLLEKDPADGKYKPKKFASLLANAALKDDNPKKNKPARIAKVNYKRDVNKSFFNLVWKSIFTGVGQTVGIEPK